MENLWMAFWMFLGMFIYLKIMPPFIYRLIDRNQNADESQKE